MVATVIVKGEKQLAATMTRAGREFGHMDATNRRVAAAVASAARGRAPRKTGRLARSITGRAGPNNAAEIVGTVVYAGVIHNGWPRHGISANPYIADVINGQEAKWVGEYEKDVDKILATVRGVA